MLTKDKKLMPYQFILFGALGLYLWRLSKRNKELGELGESGTRFNINTEGLAAKVAPWVPVNPVHRPHIEAVIREGANALLARVKK